MVTIDSAVGVGFDRVWTHPTLGYESSCVKLDHGTTSSGISD